MSTSTTDLKITEGEIELQIPSAGKPCKTWYKVIGDLKSAHRPLVALHGGPGIPHEYLLSLTDVTTNYGIPIVFYDQIGNGRSTHLPEKKGDASFWTEDLFLNELDAVLAHLGIQNDYDLLGHSWGGMLAARHAARQPAGLKRLILASALASMQLWVEAQNLLREKLPQDIQDVMAKHEAADTLESPEYHKATEAFYALHMCRMDPMPAEMSESFEWMTKDPTVYLTMLGPNEFFVTGTLKEWSVLEDIRKITVPTLLTNGRYDEAQDSVVVPFFRGISKVKWVKFAESSHMVHWEERERFMKVVGDFLIDL